MTLILIKLVLDSVLWSLSTKQSPTGVELVVAVSLLQTKEEKRKHAIWTGISRLISGWLMPPSELKTAAGMSMKGYVQCDIFIVPSTSYILFETDKNL